MDAIHSSEHVAACPKNALEPCLWDRTRHLQYTFSPDGVPGARLLRSPLENRGALKRVETSGCSASPSSVFTDVDDDAPLRDAREPAIRVNQ